MKFVKYVVICFLMLFCLTNTQCEEDDCCVPNPSFCDEQVIIDDDLFEQESPALATINFASVQGNCLVIEFGASGCDGSSWEFDVIFSTAVAESFPVQRFARFNFVNNEACLAVFTDESGFDLSSLQESGENPVVINLEGWEAPLLYEY